MDNFLDTCILINYHNEKSKLHNNSKEFINKEKEFIISEFQNIREIPYLLYRLKLRSKVIISKAIMPSKEIPEIKKLTPRDKQKVKEILSEFALGLKTIKDLFDMKQEIFLLERKLNEFILTKIKKIVTPLNKINNNLVKDIKIFNNNHQDAMVIASAIEEHQNNNLRLITSDKEDWKKKDIANACIKNNYKKIPEVVLIKEL